MIPIHSFAKGDSFDAATGTFVMVKVDEAEKSNAVFSIRPTFTGSLNCISVLGRYVKLQFSVDHEFMNEDITPMAIEHEYTPPSMVKVSEKINRIATNILTCDIGFIHVLPKDVYFSDVLDVRPKSFEVYNAAINYQYCKEKDEYIRVFSWKIKVKALLILRHPETAEEVEFHISSPRHLFKMNADLLLLHCFDVGFSHIKKLDEIKEHEDLNAIRKARNLHDIEPILTKYKHLVFTEPFRKLFDDFQLSATYQSELNRRKTDVKKTVRFKDELVEVRPIHSMLDLDPSGYLDDHFYTKEDEKDFKEHLTEDQAYFLTLLARPDHPDYEEALMTLKMLIPPSNAMHQLEEIIKVDELSEPGKIVLLPKGRATIVGKDRKKKDVVVRGDILDFVSPNLMNHGDWNDFKVRLVQLLLNAI